jgi:hypothetical protein
MTECAHPPNQLKVDITHLAPLIQPTLYTTSQSPPHQAQN